MLGERFFSFRHVFWVIIVKDTFFVQNLELFKKDALEIKWSFGSPLAVCAFELLLNSHFSIFLRTGP